MPKVASALFLSSLCLPDNTSPQLRGKKNLLTLLYLINILNASVSNKWIGKHLLIIVILPLPRYH